MALLRASLSALLITVAIAGAARSASAEGEVSSADAARAAELKKQGDESMDALRYRDALTAYERAYAITQNAALLYNQARALEALGDFPAALRFIERFSNEAPPALKARVPGLAEIHADLRQRVTTLSVRSNVTGAEVRLDEGLIGTTPLVGLKVNSGHKILVVTAPEHQPSKREVDLASGGELTIDVELVPTDVSGRVRVTSNVPGAMVSLDGQAVGQIPVEVAARAGAHRVRVERSGYEPSETSILVAVGQTKDVRIPLASQASIFTRWWFWTGAAVVVAGGVATVVALTTEKSAGSGTLPPGQLAAPLVTF